MGHPIHILSTRPLEAELIEQAVEKHIVIEVVPFIQIDLILTEGIRSLASRTLTVIFTSVNAVKAVVETLGATPVDGWKIFCIGAATRRMVVQHFGSTAVAGTAPSAAALADEILRQAPAEIFFFCGDQRRDELPDKLSAAGVRVNEWVVYRTVQTPQVVAGQYDGIAFFSPSAVESFFSVNTLTAATTLFAIGSTTADALRKCCSNSVIVSPSPDQEALVQQIIDYFQTNI
jgi:uroporphyrinogen-III synthase